jgi:hypothetical protein
VTLFGLVDKVSQGLFLLFEKLFLMLWDVKIFATGQDNASKDTFFLIYLLFQSNLGLKIAD